ncbi:serine carboxypeptidase S28 family protein [Striga asiatica]|uniref:Serine carboxypeptidase S28 family protein n=1 Tax=Striga asiatica TaxID=4170 RepID=A0A5A7Q9C6_STRAF|nr:serine carboxypeptidase S28 family protein [Striga asiatica]
MAIWLMLVFMLSGSFCPKSFSTHVTNTKKTKPIGFPFSFIQPEQAQASLDAKAVVRPYKEKFYTQILDHFNFNPNSYSTFQQRYLINDTFWDGPKGNFPIFVYTGNEGGIEWFAQNTGFMFEIAPVFRAMLVFIEHRFYGKSMPFGGSHKRAYSNSKTLGYLSATQALADYATLILDLKKNLTAENCPVVVFGGSYGGMLAAWFRLKYPHVAIGALASSAPILNFDNITSPYNFDDVITKDFRSESENCYQVIKRSWQEIEETAAKPRGLEILRKSFRICKNHISVGSLENWLYTAYYSTAMTDYPTSSNFLKPLPAYPVKQMCKAIDNVKTGNTFEKLYRAASVYYNYTGQAKCFDLNDNSGQVGNEGWAWQACTEMVLETNGDSKDSMFPAYNYTYTGTFQSCKDYFKVAPRPTWIATEFGAHNIGRVLKRSGSNIIFFNGLRDPWSPGGVLKNISESIVAIVAKEGAHHVDLRFSTSEDPKWLRDVRKEERHIISQWLTQYHHDLIDSQCS